MANIYGKGSKGKATQLHARLTRERGSCQNCGTTQSLQCAHIISRKYSNTRTDLDNALCLCASCHMRFTDNQIDFAEFVIGIVGESRYAELRKKAYSTNKVDWDAEWERLKGLQ